MRDIIYCPKCENDNVLEIAVNQYECQDEDCLEVFNWVEEDGNK